MVHLCSHLELNGVTFNNLELNSLELSLILQLLRQPQYTLERLQPVALAAVLDSTYMYCNHQLYSSYPQTHTIWNNSLHINRHDRLRSNCFTVTVL